MKTFSSLAHRTRAIFLVQALVYLAVLATIGYLAFHFFFSLKKGARRVQSVADDVLSTMHVGEQWRADIRNANGPIVVDETSLTIPLSNDQAVRYRLDANEVIREAAGRRGTSVLKDVARSRFVRDEREHITAWRWELELQPNGPNPRVKPLFTFLAVPPRPNR